MSFDIYAYSTAFDSFILEMEKVSGVNPKEISAAAEGVCKSLRIARIDILIYADPDSEAAGMGAEDVLYETSGYDDANSLRIREVTGGGNILVYIFSPEKGAEPWTDEELKRIRVFEKAIFSFNGRANVMNKVSQMTYYDPDLGIPNLTCFKKNIEEIINREEIGRYGCCSFDLRRFSVINKHIGRRRATGVMKEYIQMLRALLIQGEALCRVGSDNFMVLFEKEHLDKITAHLSGVGIIYDKSQNLRVFVSAYAGCYMIPSDCRNSSEIMDAIGAALSSARAMNIEMAFFDDKLRQSRSEVKMVENDFYESLENEEFHVYYQPKVDLKTYSLHGAEALCRWIKNGEMIPPYRFIPTLEQSKSICVLDFYMLEHTCRDIRRWLDEGRPAVTVSVNLSRRHLGDMDLLEHIISCIDKYNVPHQYIQIELTETTTDVDFSELKKIVEGLREAGISTAVDDFGIGYSSLNLIKELPWNVLKIDKSFLPAEDDANSQKYAMLKHIIALVQDIGLQAIVEGVETADQVQLLKENNCFLAQGFYFDKPLPVAEFEKRLDELKDEL